MYFSFKGLITHVKKDYVVIEVNNIGYQVFVSKPDSFCTDEIKKIYLYNVVREDEQYLAGFATLEEKEVFESLITVKGIGPRTALGALAGTTPQDLLNAIAANNVAYLKKLPGIGAKAAAQIILDLKGQLAMPGTVNTKANVNQYEEVRAALKSLGFKAKEIDDTLVSISIPNASNEEILRAALKKLRK